MTRSWWPSGRAGRIGIDLGTDVLAAIACTSDGTIDARIELPRRDPRGPIAGEVPRLVRAMARRGFRPAPVVVVPPEADTVVAELSLPSAASGAPLDEIVREQLGRMRQTDPSALDVAWWSTQRTAQTNGQPSPTTSTASAPLRSLGVGMLRTAAESIAAAFDHVGLDVDVLDLRSLALARAAAGIACDGIEVVLDLVGPAPIVVVLDAGAVSYVRRLASPDAVGGRGGFALESFAADVRLTLGYLVHRHPGRRVERLLALADPPLFEAVREAIAEALALETVAVADAIGRGLSARSVIALGAALREGVDE
jgi:hypothetical protein